MRILFMGASDVGWECLRTLIRMKKNIVGILSVPREFNISWSEKTVTNVRFKDFSDLAKACGAPLIWMTKKMGDPDTVDTIARLRPDLILAVGWYHMVPKKVRDLAPRGTLGIHASLLPKYRGGAPLVWAMINGEKRAGVSLFYLQEGVDTGDTLGQKSFPIKSTDAIKDVVAKATATSVQLIRETIPLLERGREKAVAQDHAQATIFPQRKPEDGRIDWNSKTATQAYDWIRAQSRPYPGAFTYLGGNKVTVWDARPVNGAAISGRVPGTLEFLGKGKAQAPVVRCSDGRLLALHSVQVEAQKPMKAGEFLRFVKDINTYAFN